MSTKNSISSSILTPSLLGFKHRGVIFGITFFLTVALGLLEIIYFFPNIHWGLIIVIITPWIIILLMTWTSRRWLLSILRVLFLFNIIVLFIILLFLSLSLIFSRGGVNEMTEIIECSQKNGIYRPANISMSSVCEMSTTDGGAPCRSEEDCEAFCLVPYIGWRSILNHDNEGYVLGECSPGYGPMGLYAQTFERASLKRPVRAKTVDDLKLIEEQMPGTLESSCCT